MKYRVTWIELFLKILVNGWTKAGTVLFQNPLGCNVFSRVFPESKRKRNGFPEQKRTELKRTKQKRTEHNLTECLYIGAEPLAGPPLRGDFVSILDCSLQGLLLQANR